MGLFLLDGAGRNFVGAQVNEGLETEKVLLFRKKKNPDKAKFFKPKKTDRFSLVWRGPKNTKAGWGKCGIPPLLLTVRNMRLSEFQMIGGRSIGLTTAKVIGGTVMATGTLVSGLGASWVIVGSRQNDCGGAILVVLGVTTVAAGGVAIILGAIPLAITGKRFRMDKKWDVEIGEREVKQKRKKRKKEREAGSEKGETDG